MGAVVVPAVVEEELDDPTVEAVTVLLDPGVTTLFVVPLGDVTVVPGVVEAVDPPEAGVVTVELAVLAETGRMTVGTLRVEAVTPDELEVEVVPAPGVITGVIVIPVVVVVVVGVGVLVVVLLVVVLCLVVVVIVTVDAVVALVDGGL